jgi:hypothetical protein
LNSLRIKTINLERPIYGQYNSIEEAIKETDKISSFNFDEINDTKTKVFHIGINEVYKTWNSPVVIYTNRRTTMLKSKYLHTFLISLGSYIPYLFHPMRDCSKINFSVKLNIQNQKIKCLYEKNRNVL